MQVRKHFTEEIMLKHIDDFNELYKTRPIQDNAGGMGSSHMLPLYVYLKEVNPKVIIESGVWKGQGTWLMEKACPNCKIFSIDINLSVIEYKSPLATYFDKDITTYNWDDILSKYNLNKEEDVLIFLDDHQNFSDRIDFFLENKFTNIIYEDNYPSSQGDCISPKKILAGKNFIIDRRGTREEYKLEDDFRLSIEESIKYYEEFPPIFKKSHTRWGDAWEDKNYPTLDPLLGDDSIEKYQTFYEECQGYTWITFIELKIEETKGEIIF